jgi:HlyD family secretion protein
VGACYPSGSVFLATLGRTRSAVLVAAALVVAAVALRYTVFEADPIEVRVAEVVRGRVEQTVSNSRAGTVKARRRAKLSPQEGGRVIALPKRKGDRVTSGDILLELDPSVQRARLDLARRELESAAAERRRACVAARRGQRELERNRKLAEQGIVSDDLLDRFESGALGSEAACDAARAGERRSEAQVELAQRQLEHMTLRAPFDGVIAELAIELGEWSTPSPPVIQVPSVIDVIDTSSIYVSAPMDEVDSARLREALPARVSVDSHRGQTFPGRVRRVGAYVLDIEEQNRTVEIEVELDDADFAASLLPGTSADVEVVLDVREDVLRIPTSALLSGEKALVLEGGRLVSRPLEIGLRNWDVTEVRSGLAEGEQVVVSLDRADVRAGARATVAPAEEP